MWIERNVRMIHGDCGGEVRWWHGTGRKGFVLGLACKSCGLVARASRTDVFLRELRQVAQGKRFVASFFTGLTGSQIEFVDAVSQE